jgi:hypothetical protein
MSGLSHLYMRVWSSGPKAGVWSCGSSVLGSQGVVINSKHRQSLDSNPRLPPVRRGSGGARYHFATTPPPVIQNLSEHNIQYIYGHVTTEHVRTRTERESNRPNTFGSARFEFGEISDRFGAFGGRGSRTELN